MNFVKSLDLLHVSAKEIPCLTGPGAPTAQTEGAPGVLYMDTDTGALYKCRRAERGVYHWEGTGPVKGVDYYTDQDKAEIVAAVIAELGGYPVFGTTDENNNIVVSGDLPVGTYAVSYAMEDGTSVDIGELVVPSYTNQIPISVDADGNRFVGTNGELGYKTDCKLDLTTGVEVTHSGSETTGFIPVTKNSILRTKNINYEGENARTIIGYDASFAMLKTTSMGVTMASMFGTNAVDEGDGVRRSQVLNYYAHFDTDDLKYIRLCSSDINRTSVLTVDEEIV